MSTPAISVIIPAAGAGRRFRASESVATQSKIYASLDHEPLIVRVLRVFDSLRNVREIVIAVSPSAKTEFRRTILSGKKFRKKIILVSGGETRSQSVWNGLKRVAKRSEVVCIHDAVRPLVKKEWVMKLLGEMNGCDGIVLGRGVIPTVKEIDLRRSEIRKTLNRSELFESQTPQLVKKDALLDSYERLGKRAFEATDDVSLLEWTGGRVKILTHSEPNVKVTTYDDLRFVRKLTGDTSDGALLKFGLGFDRHRLVAKRPFYLGGVRIPSPVGPLGHSDGDPLLHAVTDGILGALGAGDIGDYFPDTSKKWKHKKSDVFLKHALALARKRGSQPKQVDATVLLERPKLSKYKKKIQSRLARLLNVPVQQVNLKAKTGEGLGPEGQGRAVSCQALVVLK
jgi:2-C-methyl-D-erythritol 4-phosphate cytidylyltransferase / 2-C-methyl-D-erythritol 2,4-cyclodiphosphate synthase